MRLNEVSYDVGQPVDGYGPGFFRVGGERIEGAIFLHPTDVVTWGGFTDTDAIISLADEIDVLVLGTGEEIAHPPDDFRNLLEAAGIGIEPMASAQACRTYNVLLGEGRRVGAALLPA